MGPRSMRSEGAVGEGPAAARGRISTTSRRMGHLACAALFFVLLSACGASQGGQQRQLTIGFSNPTGAQPILHTFQQALIDRCQRLGIKVIALDAQLDVNKQVSDVDQLIAQHVDGIIVFPLAPGSLTAALNRARAAGIKVLGFNAIVQIRPQPANLAPYDADFDQGEDYQGAKLLSDLVAQRLGGGGNVLGVGIATPVPSLHFMVQQFQSYVTADNPRIHWLETVENPTDNIAGGQTVVSEAITKYHRDINAVMAYNDDSAIGAAIALKNAGVTGVTIVGQNGDPQGVNAIRSGQMTAMIDIVPWREALIGAALISRMVRGQQVPKVTETPVEMYTQQNIGQRRDWDQAVADIASGKLTCANGGCPAGLS
jgi:ribose transport system substrate-binding protein